MEKKRKKKELNFHGVYNKFEECCQDMLFACGPMFCYDEVKFTTLHDYIGCHPINLK